MIQARYGVFETNSSSVHTICMCSKSKYDKWANDWSNLKKDSLLYSRDNEDFVTLEEAVKSYQESDNINIDTVLNPSSEDHEDVVETLKYDYWTAEDYENDDTLYGYYKEYETEGGEVVVAFGTYGNDY